MQMIKHLSTKDIDKLIVQEPDITIKGYIQYCKEVEEELAAIEASDVHSSRALEIKTNAEVYGRQRTTSW